MNFIELILRRHQICLRLLVSIQGTFTARFKFSKNFDTFKKEELNYLIADLINDIQDSQAATKKKEAFENFIDAIVGN